MKRFLILSSILALAACGPIRDMDKMVHTTDEMRDNTRELNEGMKKTNEAVHRQVLVISLQQLMAPENTESLSSPARMLPYANSFAEEATPEELIKEFHTLWTDVIYGGETSKVPPTPEDVRLRSRQVSLRAASAIAAMTPADKFAEIVRNQILLKGEFEETAYAFALTRYDFTREYLFKSVVENRRDQNVQTLHAAVKYYRVMKKIASMGYADKMEFPIPVFKAQPEGDKLVVVDDVLKLNTDDLAAKGRSALRRFNRELSKDVLAQPETQRLLNELQ